MPPATKTAAFMVVALLFISSCTHAGVPQRDSGLICAPDFTELIGDLRVTVDIVYTAEGSYFYGAECPSRTYGLNVSRIFKDDGDISKEASQALYSQIIHNRRILRADAIIFASREGETNPRYYLNEVLRFKNIETP